MRYLILILMFRISLTSFGQLVGGDRIFKDLSYDHMIRHNENTLIAGRVNNSYRTNFTLIDTAGFLVSDLFHVKSDGYEPFFYDIISYGDGYVIAGYYNTAKFVEYIDEKLNSKWKTTLFNENEYNQFTILTKKDRNIIYVTWKQQTLYVAEVDSLGQKIAENELQISTGMIPVTAFWHKDHIYIYGNSENSKTALVILNNDLSLFKLLGYNNTSREYSGVVKAIVADTNRILLCDAYSTFAGLLPYENNLALTMIDNNGEIIWQHQYTGELPIVPTDIVKSSDGGFLIAGTAYNSPPAEYYYELNYDYLFMKYSSSGQLIWINTYGTTRNEYCQKILRRKDERFEVLASVPNASYYFTIDSMGSRKYAQPFAVDSGFYSANSGKWFDINKDGLTDLFSNLKVFLKEGADSFNLSQDLFPYSNEINSNQPAFGDYDNDGDLDLFLASSSQYTSDFSFFINDKGIFVIDTISGLASFSDVNFGSSWMDVDNDGFLDLFTANRKGNYLHMNNGHGGFITSKFPDNIIQYSPYQDDYFVSKHQWINFNNDKYPDLLLIYTDLNAPWESQYRARIYANHAGKFEETTDSCEIIKNTVVKYLIWEDIDNDLDDDVMLFDEWDETVYKNINGEMQNVGFDQLIYSYKGLSGEYIDFDNDGDKDIIIEKIPDGYKAVYRNDNMYFTNVWDHVLTGPFDYKPAEQWADINSDGFPDFANTGGYDGRSYLNDKNNNNWIKIRLHGNASNYDGVGATVKVQSSGNNPPYWQKQQISDENSLTTLFGLGNGTVDSVIVEWPSGCMTKMSEISEVNSELLITENCSGIPPLIIDTTICYGSSVTLSPANGNTYNWYYYLNDKEPFFTGRSLTFNLPDSSSVYFISNADSLIESRKVPLILNVEFPVEISFTDTLISTNEVLFTNQSKYANKFEWDFGDHTTTELINPVHTYSNAGIYFVTLKGWNSCFDGDMTDTLMIEPTAYESDLLLMYPTLFDDELFVIVPSYSFNKDEELSLEIFNANGTVVYSKKLYEARFDIVNSHSFRPGLYIVVVDNNKSKKIASKVVKSKLEYNF